MKNKLNEKQKASKVTVPFSKEMGKMLKKARMDAGLTQKELSRILGYGTSQFISNWERGISAPSFETYVQLAEVLKISERKLLNALKEEQERIFKSELLRIKSSSRSHTFKN